MYSGAAYTDPMGDIPTCLAAWQRARASFARLNAHRRDALAASARASWQPED